MTARKADDDWVLWNEKSAHGDPERSQSFVVSSQMKHFLFLIKTRKDRLASLSPEQMQQHVVNVRQFIESLISNGQIKVARAVEMTGFALSGFKGAFQEARLDPYAEVVSAYYLELVPKVGYFGLRHSAEYGMKLLGLWLSFILVV